MARINIHMRIITSFILVLALTGCAGISSVVPSFWDDNQSARIVDVRLAVARVDCVNALPGVTRVRDDIEWFRLYSVSKGALQKDVLAVIQPMQATAEDWYQRTAQGTASKVYCELKKSVMQQQSARAASAVLGRW
jgi:hypothetical protein